MTHNNLTEAIEEKVKELEKGMGDGSLFRTQLNYNNMVVQSVKVNELESFLRTALMDIAQQTGEVLEVEEKEIKVQEDGEYHFGENQKVIGFNSAVALFSSKKAEWFGGDKKQWICGKCEQDLGKYPTGEKLEEHSLHCDKRKEIKLDK